MISICLAYLIFTFREFKSIHKGKTAILHLCFGTEKNRRLGSKKARYIRAFRRRHLFCLHIMVGVARLELAASWSRTMRATICATPRCSFFIIMITHTVVKYQFSFYREICEICRFLFSEEMFLSVIFILTAFRNPTIIKPLRSALSCKLC